MRPMEISCWWRRLLKAIAKRADSLRRISRKKNKRGHMRRGHLRTRSLRTGDFTFAISKRCGPTTSMQDVRHEKATQSQRLHIGIGYRDVATRYEHWVGAASKRARPKITVEASINRIAG